VAGLREWQGNKWLAIFDIDTHERLAKLMDDRSPLSRDREEATPAVPAPSPPIEPAAANRQGTQNGAQR
jgi:hypothetical protein